MKESAGLSNGDQQDVLIERLFAHEAPTKARLWLTVIVLVAVGCWTLYLTWCPAEPLTVWELRDPPEVISWLRHVTVRYAVHFTAFLALGMLLPGVFRGSRGRPADVDLQPTGSDELPPPSRSRSIRWLGVLLANGAVAIVMLVATTVLVGWLFGVLALSWSVQIATEVALAVLAVVVGAWIGVWWRSGRRSLFQQALIVAGCWVILGIWLNSQLVQRRPLGFEPVTVTSADKRSLIDVVKQQSTMQGNVRIYSVSPDELNKLLTWWISVGFSSAKANGFA